ncbi:PA2169 family four-helix-bundle protein [Nitrospina gracilis]|uniref:PA2169 family four-helix-bundle protein n=1 Tax=Nitrospina gracilis TaxID=35801 RepID=UPI001F3FF9B0|nr:PA2169 family four-helix-bundle protein [Nitrospina gracilis]MCF8720192.1 DNA-binding ferritin-like protein [Nitrospina gracilis Nb-211]
MTSKFNENILKALSTTEEALKICKEAMEDANDETCRAMYAAMIKDCEKHVQMLKGEIDLHKVQKKWDDNKK